MKNKFYLIPLSLLLFNPAFATDAEDAEHYDEIVLEKMDPKLFNRLQTEIASMLDEENEFDEQEIQEKQLPRQRVAIPKKEANTQVRKFVTKPSQNTRQASKPSQQRPAVKQVTPKKQTAQRQVAPKRAPTAKAQPKLAQKPAQTQPKKKIVAQNYSNQPKKKPNQHPTNQNNANNQTKSNAIGYNKAVRPILDHGIDIWLRGDALLWQAVEENLTYVFKGSDVVVGQDIVNFDRDLHTVDFSWDWGFRLGAGYNMPRDGWDIALYWTSIRNTAHGHEHATDKEPLLDEVWTVVSSLFGGIAEKAEAHWKVNLEQLDLELGRQFRAGKFLTLRPFVGMRSDWIFQKYRVKFDGITNTTPPHPINSNVRMTNRFWGFGCVGGMDTEWKLGWGISLYGDMDFAILLGFFDTDHSGVRTSPIDTTQRFSLERSFRTGRNVFDLDLGLKWEHFFADKSYALTLKVGYEYHLYTDQNQFLQSIGASELQNFEAIHGDLTYQGVAGSVQVDF